MDRPETDAAAVGAQAVVVFEGWLNVWEAGKDVMKNLLSDGKSLKPIWEPHLCVLSIPSCKLSHFRSEKAAHDACQNMTVKLEHIGSTKEEFDRQYGYKPVDKYDLLRNSPLAGLDAVFEKSQTLDSRNSQLNISGGTMLASFEKCSSPPEDRHRGSMSSLNSQEVVKPSTSSQSKIVNFFSKKLKRTKSATKLDRKKFGNGSNGNADNDIRLPSPFMRSLSLGRISRRWLGRPQIGQRGSEPKLDYSCSEKIRNQKIGKSYSHESLLASESSLHCIDLSSEGVEVRPLHCSILGLDCCFVVIAGGGCKYYGCTSLEERNCWIRHLRRVIRPSLEYSYRKENSLEITIAEAKNLPVKRKYFCEICIDRTVYARTTSKPMLDMLFWGERFDFLHLPLIETITLNLYREIEKKKKKDKHVLLAYVNISTSEISSRQMCERWFSVNSAVVGKLGKEIRAECASIRLKARYQSVSILPITLYQPLIDYLRSDYCLMVDILEPVISVKAKEEIAASMVTSLHCLDRVTGFICDIVMAEFNRSDNITLALRGNSIATKAVEAYMKLIGSKYLINTLSELVKMILDPNLDFEVDPARVSSPASLRINQEALIKYCETFWSKIYNSFPLFPLELRKVFCAIRLQSNKGNSSGNICDQLLSSCVFLRFFCPAILNPNLFNITQEYPDERGARNLTLVAKTIQGLANFTGFGGKEQFMTFMNGFVSRELSQMHQFLKYISTVESDRGPEMQFKGEIDLGKELALLHRLLVENLKETNEVAREKLRELSSVLEGITVAQNHPVIQPPTKRSRLCVNIDRNTPSASERVASLITPSSVRRFNPPCTPTTIVSPLTPETITPSMHFAPSEINKSSIELSFVSMTSLSLAQSPLPQSHRTTVLNVSALPCSPGVRRIGGGGAVNQTHYQSTDDLLITHHLDSALPLCDENLSPSVSSLSSKRPDEKQLCKDWEKMKDAADSFSTNKCLTLIAFNDGSSAVGEGSLDRKLSFRDCSGHRKGSDVIPFSRPFFTTDMQNFQEGSPILKPLTFSNPAYRSSEINMRSTISAPDNIINPPLGSTVSLGNVDGVKKKPRWATPPGVRDGLAAPKMVADVFRSNECFKESSSSDSLTGRFGIEQCPHHKGGCLQMTIPIAGAGTDKCSSFCTTINVPTSKSLDLPSSSNSPLLSVRRVATDSRIASVSNVESNHLSPVSGYSYTQTTLPPAGNRLRQTKQSEVHRNTQAVASSKFNNASQRSAEKLRFSVDSVPLNSCTLPQSSSRVRPMTTQKPNCDSAEFSRQMDIVSQQVAETRAMVDDAELQLLGEEHGASALSSPGLLPLVPSSISVMTDQPCLNNGPRHNFRQKSIRGMLSTEIESSPLTRSTRAATVAADKVFPGDSHGQLSLGGAILPNYVGIGNEAALTLSLSDRSQSFKTTYC